MESTTGRLIIQKIILDNFKSYAGRKEIGPFHSRFSCVVGPNGSGKSNVIDAMLFVFGRRAQRLRQKKVSDLIHRSRGSPNLSYTRVTICFCEIQQTAEENVIEVPGSGFQISREAGSDNSSKYMMDGRTVPYKDISDLLIQKGVDLEHNRFLILQGEVEQISLLPAKATKEKEEGLLEFLESIIGSSQFVPAIEESQKTLDTANMVLTEHRDRMQAVRGEMDALDGPRREAERYYRQERQMYLAKAKLERVYMQDADSQLQDTVNEMKSLKEDWGRWREQREEEMKEKSRVEEQVAEKSRVAKKVQKYVHQIDSQWAALEKKDQELEASRFNTVKVIKKIGQDLQKLQLSHTAALKDADDGAKRLKHVQENLPEKQSLLERRQDDLEAAENSIQGEVAKFVKKKDALEKQSEDPRRTLMEARGNLKAIVQRGELLKEKQNKGRAIVDETRVKIDDAEKRRDDTAARRSQLEEQVKANSKKLAREKTTVGKLAEEERTINESLSGNRLALQTLEERFAEQKRNSNSISKRILEARDGGVLRGVIDSLWNVATFDEKYEYAFSAAGSNSEYIVTETTQDAESVVDFVRKEKLGRVNCIVLQKATKEFSGHIDSLDKRQGLPKSSVVLMDLLTGLDKRYRPAFYYVLRDTIVASNIDEARKIAFSGNTRYKVATLQGQVIEKSGVMTGGMANTSIKKRSGGGAPPVDTKDIEKRRAELDRQTAELRQIREKHRTAEQQIEILQSEVTTAQHAIDRTQEEHKLILEEISGLQRLLKTTKVPDLTSEERAELRHLDASAAEEEKNIGKLQEEVNRLQAMIEDMEEQINEVGGDKVRQLRTNVKNLEKDVASMKKDLETGEVNIQFNRTKAEKIASQDIPNKQKEEIKEKGILETIDEDRTAMEKEAAEVLQKKDEAQAAMDEAQAAVSEVSERLRALTESGKDTAMKDVEFQNQYSDLEVESQRRRNIVKKHLKTLEKLKQAYDSVTIIEEEEEETKPQLKNEPEENKGDTGNLPAIADIPDENAESAAPNKQLAESKRQTFDDVLALESEEVSNLDLTALEVELAKLTTGLESSSKPNAAVVEQYRETRERFKKREGVFLKTRDSRDAVKRTLDSLVEKRRREFLKGFRIIACRLQEMYQMLTLGGDAELEVVDENDPFSEGILFSVRPPRKSWKQIQNLSGGEKTLSSLALIFALHYYKPSPLYFLDEIDAALDFRNVSIIARSLALRTDDAQFIIISLRNHMFEKADRLVGIFKTADISKSICLDPDAFAGMSKKSVTDTENAVKKKEPIQQVKRRKA